MFMCLFMATFLILYLAMSIREPKMTFKDEHEN